MNNSAFSQALLKWFDQHGRKNLPWQIPITPYRTWVSEIMLQQTQVDTVIPYFLRFLDTFPTVQALAEAKQDDVLHLWTGLGYYARARNLHACAKIVQTEHNGTFPSNLEALIALPGIGPSTAAAISSIAFGQPDAILDGNVKRVLARFFAVEGWPGKKNVEQALWVHARNLMPNKRCRDYTQAIMDLGATLCTKARPQCQTCPVQTKCVAYKQNNPQDYPHKKPKKTLPEKHLNMLLVSNQQTHILLLKRPDKGIWGGLWSLPEAEDMQTLETFYLNLFGHPLTAQSYAKLRHTFSHYHLHIHAHTATVAHKNEIVMDSRDHIWYNLKKPNNIGLAAPVKKLLNTLAQPHSHKLEN